MSHCLAECWERLYVNRVGHDNSVLTFTEYELYSGPAREVLLCVWKEGVTIASISWGEHEAEDGLTHCSILKITTHHFVTGHFLVSVLLTLCEARGWICEGYVQEDDDTSDGAAENQKQQWYREAGMKAFKATLGMPGSRRVIGFRRPA